MRIYEENKKVRKQENTLPNKKAIKKKKENTLSAKKAIKKKTITAKKKSSQPRKRPRKKEKLAFFYFLVFFYKFSPLVSAIFNFALQFHERFGRNKLHRV